MYYTNDFKKSLKVLYKQVPHELTFVEHHKPGKGAAIVRVKLKNMFTQNIINQTFRSGDSLPKADLSEIPVNFLFKERDVYFFLNIDTYEQFEIQKKLIKYESNFLIPDTLFHILLFNEDPISIKLPNHISLNVVKCEHVTKGNTVNNTLKKATLKGGYICNVPSFIALHDTLKIDTRTGLYIERIKIKK